MMMQNVIPLMQNVSLKFIEGFRNQVGQNKGYICMTHSIRLIGLLQSHTMSKAWHMGHQIHSSDLLQDHPHHNGYLVFIIFTHLSKS